MLLLDAADAIARDLRTDCARRSFPGAPSAAVPLRAPLELPTRRRVPVVVLGRFLSRRPPSRDTSRSLSLPCRPWILPAFPRLYTALAEAADDYRALILAVAGPSWVPSSGLASMEDTGF